MIDRTVSDEAIETMLAGRAARAGITGLQARIAADVRAHPRDVRVAWRSRAWLMIAMLLAGVIAAAAWATVGQQPATPMTFAPGSLAFVRQPYVFVTRADGSDEVAVTPGESREEIGSLAFSPDRSAIAYVRDSTLYVRAADGQTAWTYPGRGGWMIFSWSPDGTELAVSSYSATGPAEIELLGSDGRSLKTLALPEDLIVNGHAWIAPLPWSPDGHWIAVGACRISEGCGINVGYYLLVATDGSGTRWLSPDHHIEDKTSYLAWAPDGTVALPRWETGSVAIASADGTLLREVGLPGGQKPAWGSARDLAWSPDGARLAIVADDLLVAEGNRVTTVASPEPGSLRDVHWSSDGLRVIFRSVDMDSQGEANVWSVAASGGTPVLLVADVAGGLGTLDVLP